jgi:hypothetical protein
VGVIKEPDETALEKAQRMQDQLVNFSTGGGFEGEDAAFRKLRTEVLAIAGVDQLLPSFIKRHRDLNSFWQFIKRKFQHYAERREFLWESFRPLLDQLEADEGHPAAKPIEAALTSLDQASVSAIWKKALERRISDPEGAITAARALLESACKHVLDELQAPYPDDANPGKLWALCADHLNLSPSQHSEVVFKSILGNCQSIVNNLAAIRNKVGDAHGQGKRAVKAKPRHAELAVNLAGSMAAFLVATWSERSKS